MLLYCIVLYCMLTFDNIAVVTIREMFSDRNVAIVKKALFAVISCVDHDLFNFGFGLV